MQPEEKRIYCVVAGTIQVPVAAGSRTLRTVIQPAGRQIAQACHVVSMLRHYEPKPSIGIFEPMTTIILQARDSAEMQHVWYLLHRKHLEPVTFSDENPEYGPGDWPTAIAALATKKQTIGILDYLPMWGSK